MSARLNLSSVCAELREVSDRMQCVKSSFQLCQSGATLLPQLSLSQLSVLQEEYTQA